MKAHRSTLVDRMRRAGARVNLRCRVVAVGIDGRGRIIGIATNTPRLRNRSWHAEERLIHRQPRSLSMIVLGRFGLAGVLLPIDPCPKCAELAARRGITIQPLAGAPR